MARRIVDEQGGEWDVAPSVRVSQYDVDELSLEFRRVGTSKDERRYVRFSPRGSQVAEMAFEETTDAALRGLLKVSQVGWTTPDGGYTPTP